MENLKSLGFEVLAGEHLYSDAWGFSGSAIERAEDFNRMAADDACRMIFFGGGEVCNEILPLIDYNVLRDHPKIICSFSDGTTIVNAVNCMCGLVTFYGASPHTFDDLSEYNWRSFSSRLMSADTVYTAASPWRTICPGRCEGVLTGGYLVNYATLYGLQYYPEVPYGRCLLFIEDHEMFSTPAIVSKYFSNLEHRGVFEHVSGLIFGHYSIKENPLIDDILRRVGVRFGIPVVRCEDFGHGENNAVLPIGVRARLDTENGELSFLESCTAD